MLSIHELVKCYKGRSVVNNVSLSIQPGEIVGLLGPNGAGKTTCFYILVGLIHCDSGKVLLGKHDITYLPMHTRARLGVGYLPQEPSVFRKLTASENIMAILELRKDLNDTQRHERLDQLIEEFNLTIVRDSLGISLSGGERRRVEIARALALDPLFMLLDEPFAGVDPISVIDIKKIIMQLKNRGIGVLITDHNVRETLTICERAYIMNNGEIIATGNANEVLANQDVRRVYLGEEFKI